MSIILSIIWGGFSKSIDAAFTFFSKPPGAYIGIAIAFVLALWWFGQHEFNKGEAMGRAKCEDAHAVANALESIRQTAAINITNKASDARTAQSTVINKGNEKVIIHVKDQAEAMPGASDECVSAAIADGLRSLH